MKKIAAIVIILLLAGCVKPEKQVEQVSEPSGELEIGPGIGTEVPQLPSMNRSIESPELITPEGPDFGEII
jgi:PBP1b-binding outer membrane lipoprotein LpoB